MVLETTALASYATGLFRRLGFSFFVDRVLPAPLAVLFEIKFVRILFLVLRGGVVLSFTIGACQNYNILHVFFLF